MAKPAQLVAFSPPSPFPFTLNRSFMQPILLGYARFGKQDGFEWQDRGGILDLPFASPELQALSLRLALRQEAIRTFPNEEILACSHLILDGQLVRLISLYQYALDQYKRDGYRAATFAIQGGKLAAGEILTVLKELLAGQAWQPQRNFRTLVNHPPPLVQASSKEDHQAFVWLGGDMNPSAVLEAYWQDTFFLYQWVYASAGVQTMTHLDRRSVDVFGLPNEQVLEAEVVPAPESDPSAAPPESLIFAFESSNHQQWDSPPQRSGPWKNFPWLRRWLGK
ncbi:MAG: hypothetical protein AAF399_20290 [Bacteroidota bacterium]